ncbi:hypothetical protein [Hymenobacter sp. CRA2]|uniref:hypothetical protein n=1 Tax=Hymenobacter sp. CRA2 TaxID=1955620 RepID=UPI00098EF0F0|nr:hypothetical protein [Hymenobacter sp. CRA2]OON65912.1 hypothetical protein B0919_23090 [Hymenobacter sp. CRA2]
MEIKDIFITPFYLGLLYLIAFAVRPRVTNAYTRKYFIPALSLKFVGAIALGLIYQFYYSGGDTYNYFHHIKLVYTAFTDSPHLGLKLLTAHGETDPETISYTMKMFWYSHAETEYFIVRIGTVLALLCFCTYTVIALFFAAISFSGMWVMYITFIKIRPQIYHQLAIACFFIPSVFFWGSGLMKDSLCIGALGWVFYGFYQASIQKRRLLYSLVMGGIAGFMLYSTKVYILLSFLPPALLWVFNENSNRIKSTLIRMLAKPVLIGVGAVAALFVMTNLTKGDEKYDVDKIGERSKITADYLYQTSLKQEGSAYSLGEQDGTIGGMAKLAPQAIIVALYRPFLWEVRNPVMLLSSLEGLFFLLFTLRIMYRSGVGRTLALIARTPVLTLCFVFALVFAASVGIISYNFGTLVRYKIPLIPFYLAGLYILQSMSTERAPAARRPATARRRLATT